MPVFAIRLLASHFALRDLISGTLRILNGFAEPFDPTCYITELSLFLHAALRENEGFKLWVRGRKEEPLNIGSILLAQFHIFLGLLHLQARFGHLDTFGKIFVCDFGLRIHLCWVKVKNPQALEM